jgi:WD40 repeat protein
MGVVYEAVDTRINRTVALKLLRCLLLVSETDKARFRVEAETAARLEHSHIVPVYEVNEFNRQPYFTMKLMEGGSLVQRMKRGSMPVREAAGLVSTIARAVHHAHLHGVLHRDLKPGNVLFDRAGTPFLTDFGLAKVVNSDAGLTLSSVQLGTPHYMPPEQVAGDNRAISTASDVWGLGVILYELVAGEVPFPGERHIDIFRRIQESDPAPPSLAWRTSRSGSVSHLRDIDTLCLRCLEKDPARRLSSANELADELDRWLRGEPIHSRPVTSFERAIKWVGRNRRITVLMTALAMALVGGAITSTVLWRQAESDRRLADTRAEAARAAEHLAADNAYFATVANALAARQQGQFGPAQRMLASLDPARRGFEWKLVNGFCRGDDWARTRLDGTEPRCVAWVPARRRLAILAADRTLRWLDPENGRVENGARVPDPRAAHGSIPADFGFHSLSFASDGRHFSCGDGDILIIAETDTGRLLRSSAGRRMTGLWLNSSRVLYSGNNLWGADRGDVAEIFDLHQGKIAVPTKRAFAPFALSGDGQRFAWTRAGDGGNWLEVRKAGEEEQATLGEPLFKIQTTNGSPALVEFSSDDRYLAMASGTTAGVAKTVSVYSMEDGKCVFFQEWASPIHAIRFSQDEPVLAVATDTGALVIIQYLQSPPTTSVYDDDRFPGLNQPVGVSGPQEPPADLLSRSAFDGQVAFQLGHEERIRDIAYMPGLRRFVTASDDHTVRQWNRLPAVSQSRVGGVWTMNWWEHPAMSADGRYALYRAGTNRTWLWDRERGKHSPTTEFEFPLAVLKDGRTITRHFETGAITAWAPPGPDGGDLRTLWRISGIPSFPRFGRVIRGKLSRNERLVAGLIPGKLLVVDLEKRTSTGTDDQRMLYGETGINCMDLSPDGSLIAVTGFIGMRARLYRSSDVNGGHISLGDAPTYDTAVAFHPTTRRLFVGNEDGWVRVFDVDTHLELTGERWRAQAGAVTALAVMEDGGIVATSGDRTIHFWDALPKPNHPRRERLGISVAAARNWMQFSTDGNTFMHIAPGNPLEAWETFDTPGK